jgi:hypothetical protein
MLSISPIRDRQNPCRPFATAAHSFSKSKPNSLSTHLLDVVVAQGAAILELLASEDQSLLVRGNTLLVLDLGLDVVDGVGGLHLEGDGLARQGLHEAGRRKVMLVCRQ